MSTKKREAECVRRVANWSKIESKHRFDKKTYNKKATLEDMEQASPKLGVLFQKIKDLDAHDMEKDGHVYKHMIYSDVKSLGYGAKIISSAFIANGFMPSYGSDLEISEKGLQKAPYKNFAVLCSTPVYEKPIPVRLKQSILQVYNSRPENVHGKNIRFLILDQGYKEGIDVLDIKYIHLFEPTITKADERQAIGRGTRMCGQKGLKFHHEKGWPLYVFRYNNTLPDSRVFLHQPTTHDLFIELSGLNSKMITLSNELDKMCVIGSVDYDLTKNIHSFHITGKDNVYELSKEVERELMGKNTSSPAQVSPVSVSAEKLVLYGREYYKGQPIKCKEGCKGSIPVPTIFMLIAWMMTMKDRSPFYSKRPRPFLCKALVTNKVYCDILNLIWQNPFYFILTYKPNIREKLIAISRDKQVYSENIKNVAVYISEELHKMKEKTPPSPPIPQHMPPETRLTFSEMRAFIEREFGDYKWSKIDIRDQCSKGGAMPTIVDFTPSQKFVKDYFIPSNPYKGMLIYQSVGTGKLCLGIATATNSFEKEGYTILWVTRHTLKSDVWKNMFHQVCNVVLQEQLEAGLEMPEKLIEQKKLLSNNWIEPISYKQFTNFLKGKNKKLSDLMIARNGTEDPLHKTLVIIDEAHKLYAPDVSGSEKPDVNVLKKMIHNSYRKSGAQSARVLLMTATPYTTDPMDLIKLLNMLRNDTEQLPEIFEEFAIKYLNKDGMFTKQGTVKFLNEITGYISYLNRENDIRQFAYPIISDVLVPISKTPSTTLYREIENMKVHITEQTQEVEENIADKIEKIRAQHVIDQKACEDISNSKERAECKREEMKRYKETMENAKKQKDVAKERTTKLKTKLKEAKQKLEQFEKNDISQETILKTACFGIDPKNLQ